MTTRIAEAEVTPPGHSVIMPGVKFGIGVRVKRQGFSMEFRPRLRRPNRLLFGAVGDPRVRFKRPIRLRVFTETGIVVVHWPDVDEFGYGPNLSTALEDFKRTLAELFMSLNDPDKNLSPHLQSVRSTVNKFLELRSKL